MLKRQSATRLDTDAFFDLFDSARVKGGSVTTRTLVRTPRDFPHAPVCYFHFVEDARCVLRLMDEKEDIPLQPDDLVILPRGSRHRLICAGDAEGSAQVTTGEFEVTGPSGKLLVGALPALLHVSELGTTRSPFPRSASDWLTVTLAAIRLESRERSLGSSVMISRLMDLLFVWALRHWLSSASRHEGKWIQALGDAVVGRALLLMHSEPERAWSVETLAQQLNQSRSGFSQRFVATMGEPPMRYLARWRMHIAAELLGSTRLRISQVAQRVGYDSESAFSRAFRQHAGVAPMDYRRQLK